MAKARKVGRQQTFRSWFIQNCEDALGCAHARHAGVEARPQQAQRQVELWRQDQHKEGLLKGQAPVQQAQADLDRHHGRAERGNQSPAPGRRGRSPAARSSSPGGKRSLTCSITCHLGAAAPEGLQRRQPLQHIQKVGAHAAEALPLAAVSDLGRLPIKTMKMGISGAVSSSTSARKRVERENKDQEGQRHERRQDQLRQVLAEVGIQRSRCHPRAVLVSSPLRSPRAVDWAQRQDMLRDERLAQAGFDAHGNGTGRDFAAPGSAPPAAGLTPRQDHQQAGSPVQGVPFQENLADHLAQQTRPGSPPARRAANPDTMVRTSAKRLCATRRSKRRSRFMWRS